MQIKLRGQKLKCAASIVTTWGGKELGFWKAGMSMTASPQVKQQAPILHSNDYGSIMGRSKKIKKVFQWTDLVHYY